MKLLLDSCIPLHTKEQLQSLGYDVVWIGDWEKDPGDPAILEYSCQSSRILVTLDNDFGKLIVYQKKTACALICLRRISTSNMPKVIHEVLIKHSTDLANKAMIFINQNKVRIKKC